MPSVTMTLARIASMAIARQHADPLSAEQTDATIARAQGWLTDELDPKVQNWPQPTFHLYLFHCGERAATMNRDDRLGPTDWRKDWLPVLLADQDEVAGGWIKEPLYDRVNTSLALLCLSPAPAEVKRD